MPLSRTLPTIALLFAANACVGGNAPEDPYDLGDGSPEISGDSGGSGSLEGPVPKAGSRDSHFPLVDGARFTFRHTNLIDDPWEETQTIVSTRYEGEDAFLLSDQEDAEGEQTQSTPLKGLRLGAAAVGMPTSNDYKRPFDTSGKDVLPAPPDPLYPREQRWAAGKAYGVDVTYERHRLMVRAEGLLGDRVDVDERYGARSFWSAWALAAYEVRWGGFSITPALRAEWLDSDREHDVGRRREVTAGVSIPYKERARFLLDVKRTDAQRGTPVLDSPKPLPAVPYFERDSTRVTAQFQLEL